MNSHTGEEKLEKYLHAEMRRHLDAAVQANRLLEKPSLWLEECLWAWNRAGEPRLYEQEVQEQLDMIDWQAEEDEDRGMDWEA